MEALLLWQAAGLRRVNNSRAPKVFYLFLAEDGLMQEDIWVDYFSRGARVEYQAFIHCADSDGCKEGITRPDIFTQVATVPSKYCDNLIDPMLALASAAYNVSDPDDAGVDKFIFVSDNSLPVRPFADVQRAIIGDDAGLARFRFEATAEGCHKASQWSVLSRDHVARLLEVGSLPLEQQVRTGCLKNPDDSWAPPGGWVPMCPEKQSVVARFRGAAAAKIHSLFGPPRPDRRVACLQRNPKPDSLGCSDEFWPLMAIFGQAVSRSEPDRDRMRTLRYADYMWADWSHFANDRSKAVSLAEGEGSDEVASLAEGPWGPSTIRQFTAAGLRSMAKTPFLFTRKVLRTTTFEDSSMSLRDAFRRYVFGEGI